LRTTGNNKWPTHAIYDGRTIVKSGAASRGQANPIIDKTGNSGILIPRSPIWQRGPGAVCAPKFNGSNPEQGKPIERSGRKATRLHLRDESEDKSVGPPRIYTMMLVYEWPISIRDGLFLCLNDVDYLSQPSKKAAIIGWEGQSQEGMRRRNGK